MALECLNNFVGIRNCSYAPSLSGLYVDSLPGIDYSWLDQMASDEQVTGVGLWNDCQANALLTFQDDMKEEFGKRWLIKQITQSVDLGKSLNLTNPTLTTPVAGQQYGMILETTWDQQLASAQSTILNIMLQNVSFYWQGTNPTPSFTLNVVDCNTGNNLYTTIVSNAVAGWNTVWVNKEFTSKRIYVLVSGNFTVLQDLDISNFYLSNFGTQPGYGWGQAGGWLNFWWGGYGCGVRVQGAQWNGNPTSTSTNGPNTYGLSAQISAKCSYDSIVCMNMQHFAAAWQHCLAIELLNYRIYSAGLRINKFSTVQLEPAIQAQKMYTLKYRGGRDEDTGLSYPGKLRQAIESIQLNTADCCLKANSYLSSVIAIV